VANHTMLRLAAPRCVHAHGCARAVAPQAAASRPQAAVVRAVRHRPHAALQGCATAPGPSVGAGGCGRTCRHVVLSCPRGCTDRRRDLRLHVASLASAAETADGAESTETVRDDSGRQSQLPTEFREIAEITNTHGVRGEVRVRPMTDFPQQRLETVRTPSPLTQPYLRLRP
jgi:hypothetical protein